MASRCAGPALGLGWRLDAAEQQSEHGVSDLCCVPVVLLYLLASRACCADDQGRGELAVEVGPQLSGADSVLEYLVEQRRELGAGAGHLLLDLG